MDGLFSFFVSIVKLGAFLAVAGLALFLGVVLVATPFWLFYKIFTHELPENIDEYGNLIEEGE